MRALWLENQTLAIREVARPVPQSGEVLIRVLVAGICNTDVELTRGYYPFTGIPGHEFVGAVESGPRELTGRRVVPSQASVSSNRSSIARQARTSEARW